MVAVLRAVGIEHNFAKQKQIVVEMTDRWQHFVAVISNQNRYWCRRSVACKQNSDHGGSKSSATTLSGVLTKIEVEWKAIY
jgi:hypothetical protein